MALVSGREGAPLWERFGQVAYEGFGMDAADAGDWDSDRVPDVAVLVSSPSGENPPDRLLVLSGIDGLELAALELPPQRRGMRLAALEDLDGDHLRAFGLEGVLCGLIDPLDGERSLWTVSRRGWRLLRPVSADEPAWGRVRSAVLGELGKDPLPFAVLSCAGVAFSDYNRHFVLTPLLPR